MNELNKTIRTMEIMILDRKLTESEFKRELEMLKLNEKNKIDKKNPEFSNEEKREIFVGELTEIQDKAKNLREYQYNTSVMEIELRFKLREFDILVKYIRDGVPGCQ